MRRALRSGFGSVKYKLKYHLTRAYKGKRQKSAANLAQNTAERDNRRCFCMRWKIPEPWAARVCGPNRDKEVLASMADGTKTDAAPEAPGGPPAPEQTEQAGIPGMDGGPAPSGKGKRTARRCWPRSGLP